MTVPRITADMLRELGADCDRRQIAIFRNAWPGGAPVTAEAILRAHQLELDVDWLAQRVLLPGAWADFRRFRAEAWDRCLLAAEAALAARVEGEADDLAEYYEYGSRVDEELAHLLHAALTSREET